jgi:hypothetical protein
MTARDVIVSGDASGFVQEIIVGPHRLTAGEPIEVGGESSLELRSYSNPDNAIH